MATHSLKRGYGSSAGNPVSSLRSQSDHALIRVRNFNAELDRLLNYQRESEPDLIDFVRECTRSASHSLDVERVSFWIYSDDSDSITCFDMYNSALGTHASGDVLLAQSYPAYFYALSINRVIDASDAHTDVRTREFRTEYLQPNDIRSMLDAQVRTSNKLRGVVCCEKVVEMRQWTPDEVSFVASIADFIGLALGNEDRRQSEKVLAQAHRWVHNNAIKLNRLALVAEHADDVIIIADPEGRIVWVNASFERLTEFTLEEVRGQKPGSFLQGPGTAEADKQKLTSALSKHETVRMELLNYSKSGREYWLDIRIDPIFDNNGGLEGFIAVERDVTDRVLERQQLASALEDAQAGIKSKSEFLANMSHEIRTPLNGILATARMIRAQGYSSTDVEKIDLIVRSGETLLSMINNVLDLASLESGKQTIDREDFSVSDVLSNTIALLRDYGSENGVLLTYDIDARVPPILNGDSGKLSQIIFNLLGNAIKFSEGGGASVSVQSREMGGEAIQLSVSVEDDGPGIPPEVLDNLFQRFHQGDNSNCRVQGGSGLGLSICKNLCELLGGDISVSTREGQGSKFTFTVMCALPKDVEGNELRDIDAECRGPTDVHSPGAHPTVLVAEDNAINQKIIMMMLETMGMKADCVANGQEAISALEANSYDLVLMDIQMPVKDGIMATREIRDSDEAFSKVPIVAVTANTSASTRKKCLEAGIDGFVEKPIKPSDLIREIESVFG